MHLLALFMAPMVSLIVFATLASLPVMLLWNWALVPAVTGLHEIGWLQAFGILVLSTLLFKSSKLKTTVKKD